MAEQRSTYDFVIRDEDGERVSRHGNVNDKNLRRNFEKEVEWAKEDGYEVLGIRLNGLSPLYTIDEVERMREEQQGSTTAATRRCDSCGGALPDRMARQRDPNGRLVCNSCKANPQPKWAASQHTGSRIPHGYEGTGEISNHTCDTCGAQVPFEWAQTIGGPFTTLVPAHDDGSGSNDLGTWCARHRDAYQRTGSQHTSGLCPASYTETFHPDDPEAPNDRCYMCGAAVTITENPGRDGMVPPHEPKQSSQHVAHDSGDGARVYHCPFCGSGAVTGGSDGTVSCSMCHTDFTVQVQPAHPSMPQTIDGQPYTPPGMPGGAEVDVNSLEDPVGEDEEGVASTSLEGEEGPPVDEQPPPEGGPPPPEEQGQQPPKKPGKVPPQFRRSHLLTTTGDVLDEDRYLKHLAIRHADDRTAVLNQVRGETEHKPLECSKPYCDREAQPDMYDGEGGYLCPHHYKYRND